MIVNHIDGSEWLKYAMNHNIRHQLTDKNIYQLKETARKSCCGFSLRYFEENKKDPTFYLPFFETIQSDVYEFYMLHKHGNLRLLCYWPYNKEIENELKGKINGYKKFPYYNDLTEVIFTKSDSENGYLGNQMNQFGYYEQAYQDEYSVRLYHFAYHDHCQSFGGICLFIEKETNNIFIFGIGEDDGWMFPETYCYHDYEISGINTFELWRLCSMVNDINVPGIDNQTVIEKLYEQHKNE